MKKLVLLIIALVFVGYITASRIQPVRSMGQKNTNTESINDNRDPSREPPEWSFSTLPTILLQSYYDYMIGSYNSLPLRVNPTVYGGYFLTFQGKRVSTGTRRVFYSYLDNSGEIQNNNEITSITNNEGFPSVAVDPVSGKSIYAWEANVDGTGEPLLEVEVSSDAFYDGYAGLFNDPITVINNPITIIAPNQTSTYNNEFIKPIVQIGPSPNAGMRRAYIMGKNNTTHTSGACENPYIAYADFNADMIECGEPFIWNYISVPLLNQWNTDVSTWRQPYYSFCTGNDGRIYIVGYHSNDLLDVPASTPDLDVLICDNYGQGTWQYISHNSHIPAFNPRINHGEGAGYFTNVNGSPYSNNQVFLKITNSSHLNAVMDNNGIIHMIGIWGLGFEDGTQNTEINTIKDMTFDSGQYTFHIYEIYPVAGTSGDNEYWLPWDQNADGMTDSYNDATGNPNIVTDWNFPYWDEGAHNNSMIAQYNNLKITQPNSHGQMAAVWQNSWRARQANVFNQAAYLPYADVPEIYISYSQDNGQNWYDPIIINSVDIPGFSTNHPMWVYPADKIKYVSQNLRKLGLLYFDDIEWGSSVLSPPEGRNSGGYVKFMEVQIGQPNVPPLQSGIQGTICRADNLQPIANATVTSGNTTTTTNVDGYYTMTLANGLHTLTIQATGFITQTLFGLVVPINSYLTQNSNMTPLGETITGSVAHGNPPLSLPGARVHILSNNYNASAITNGQGLYTMTNMPGERDYTISIFCQGYDSYYSSFHVFSENVQLPQVVLYPFEGMPVNVEATIAENNKFVEISWDSPNAQLNRNLIAYKIWRMFDYQVDLPESWTCIGSYPPDVLEGNDNTWSDLTPGAYIYAVKACYSLNAFSPPSFSNPLVRVSNNDPTDIPSVTRLRNSYPNPFRSITRINYDLKTSGIVKIDIYNLAGQHINTLLDECKQAGEGELIWNGKDSKGNALPSGVYLCKLKAGNAESTLKLILLR